MKPDYSNLREKFTSFLMKISHNNPWIFVILLLMFVFLIIGFNWGPTYHPDEIYRRSLEVLITQQFNPEDYYHIPWGKPSGHVYLLAFLIGLYYLISFFLSFFGIGDLLTLILYSRNNASLLGRIVTLVMAMIAGFIIFQIGYEIGNEKNKRFLAILSPFFLTVSNIWINNSHFGTTDVPMTFWLIFAIYFLYKAQKNPKLYLLAGCLGGFALTTKWTGGLFFIVLSLELMKYIIWNQEKSIPNRLMISIGSIFCFGFGFLIGSPFFLLDFPDSYNYLVGELEGHNPIPPFQNIPKVFELLIKGIGLFPTLIGWIFLVCWTAFRNVYWLYTRIKDPPKKIKVIQLEKLDIVGTITWVFIIFQLRFLEIRDVIPLIPFFCIFIAYGVLLLLSIWIRFYDFLKSSHIRYRKIIPSIGFSLTLILFCVPPLILSLYNSYSIQTDTRLQAEEWMKHNLAEGSIIARDERGIWYYYPVIDTNKYSLLLIEAGFLDILEKATFDYIIFSSFWYLRFNYSTERFSYWDTLLNNKHENYTVVADFNRHILGYEGILPPMEFISPRVTIVKKIA